MKKLTTPVWAALAAAALALGAAGVQAADQAPAQTQAQAQVQGAAPAAADRHAERRARWQQKREQRAQRLKEKLQLSAAQMPAWERFQQALQPAEHARLQRGELKGLSTPERIDRMRALREQQMARMDQRDEAVKAFYAQLNAEQQKVFDAQGLRGGHHGHGERHGAHRHGQQQRGASAS
ncbi:Spy/CpxP family protein refolding chaperone [Comamonas sp. NLF-1-9]|uniref:Spy/CpxP family protein refolding chaperone n=1 Tax=Comamonas sp. NLF-1-9 TaxID=2853163 RepID=UPI001C46C26C|nr:Spy/CpxP family protein refolding chaperone [Comamonas sp. NLF-1-9]QXL83875.1 Spy/CpxP family protein refolding chaperone [Comamonas sp. NLF-1-9]